MATVAATHATPQRHRRFNSNTCLLQISCMHVELPVLLLGKLSSFFPCSWLASCVGVGVGRGMWDFWADWFSFYIDLLLSFLEPCICSVFPSSSLQASFLLATYLRQWLCFFLFFFSSSVFLHKRRWRSQQPNLSYPIILSDSLLSKRHLTTGCICICACVIYSLFRATTPFLFF